jgi:hypothetical protein
VIPIPSFRSPVAEFGRSGASVRAGWAVTGPQHMLLGIQASAWRGARDLSRATEKTRLEPPPGEFDPPFPFGLLWPTRRGFDPSSSPSASFAAAVYSPRADGGN